MRLRRETGDFQIKVAVDAGDSSVTVNTLIPNLLAEDFVGQIVDADGHFEVVTKVTETATTVVAYIESFTLTYTKATGAIAGVAVSP